jgi:hypothetical protein
VLEREMDSGASGFGPVTGCGQQDTESAGSIEEDLGIWPSEGLWSTGH